MRLPALERPESYRGLYVYDFGDWTAAGYTADEIAVLLESAATRGGRIYKIHRADPNGQIELRGVSPERFQMESGMLFYRSALDPAQADFAALAAVAEKTPCPCRAVVHLVEYPAASEGARYVTALVFPAEYEDEIGRWLLETDFRGGDLVEGGISQVSGYYQQPKNILQRQQLWSRPAIPSRSPADVLASVRRAVQR